MNVLAITGYARSGKDTLFSLLREINGDCRRVAFADALKVKVAPFIRDTFGWDVWDLTQEQKNLVRPLLVWLGASMRSLDEDYWVKIVHSHIQDECFTHFDEPPYWRSNCMPVITDCRYANEAKFLKEHYDCFIIKIEREGVGPANEEEAKNQPEVEPYVDFRIKWPEADRKVLKGYGENAYGAWLHLTTP